MSQTSGKFVKCLCCISLSSSEGFGEDLSYALRDVAEKYNCHFSCEQSFGVTCLYLLIDLVKHPEELMDFIGNINMVHDDKSSVTMKFQSPLNGNNNCQLEFTCLQK